MKKIDCSAELEKEIFIAKLLDLGIYKKGDRQLFELSLDDLTEEYERIMNVKIFE
ncbi:MULTISPECIES: Fur-regulated basic protein FbpA [Bacillus]|uniref:Fur-regulated basic protein FbpA n=1 Tax=Bacillus TaxID=1386 RepID=UPI001FEB3FD4|nr:MULTISPECIES: Fur-regulated basic protein FbpA [Bacillus]